MAVHVVKNDGLLALYNGLSASLCRQVRLCNDQCADVGSPEERNSVLHFKNKLKIHGVH